MGFPKKLAQAKQLAVYFDNWVNHISTIDDKQPNVGSGNPKPAQTELYIKPFGLDLDTDQFLKVNGTTERWSSYQSQLTGYAKADLNEAGGEFFLKLRNVTPAKIIIKTGMSTTPTVKTAVATKRKYANYGGTAGSLPFGRQTAGENELEAYQAIRALILATGLNTQTSRISRQKEKV